MREYFDFISVAWEKASKAAKGRLTGISRGGMLQLWHAATFVLIFASIILIILHPERASLAANKKII